MSERTGDTAVDRHRPLYQHTGAQLRMRRERAGLSRRELGEQISDSRGHHPSEATIRTWERGSASIPLWALHELSMYWDCTLDDLVPVLIDRRQVSGWR